MIKVNGEEIENASSPTWEEGENTVEITVTYENMSTTYTVIVTKETEDEG